MVYKAEHDIPGPFGSLKPMQAPMNPELYEEIFERYYEHPYGTDLPSAGLYGSRGPFYDQTTLSGDKKTSLPVAQPDLQKQVQRYPGETREEFWDTQTESVKEKMRWDKELQKFKQREAEHNMKLQQIPLKIKSKGYADPYELQEAEWKENAKWEEEKQKWAQK